MLTLGRSLVGGWELLVFTCINVSVCGWFYSAIRCTCSLFSDISVSVWLVLFLSCNMVHPFLCLLIHTIGLVISIMLKISNVLLCDSA